METVSSFISFTFLEAKASISPLEIVGKYLNEEFDTVNFFSF